MAWEHPYRRESWLKKLDRLPQKQPEEQLSRWIPDEYMLVRNALNILGKSEFLDWNGNELNARCLVLPPDKPWLWSNYKKEVKYFLFAENEEINECTQLEAEAWWETVEPKLKIEWEAEKSAFARWYDCVNLMRNRLSNKTYNADVLEKNGTFNEVPVNNWIGENGSNLLITGVARFELPAGYSSIHINGPILLKRNFLNARTTTPKVQSTDFKRFPYLNFLLQASTSELFNDKGRIEKKLIEHWLRQNWPEELGVATETKISTLATYLRKPEDEKGGLKSKAPAR